MYIESEDNPGRLLRPLKNIWRPKKGRYPQFENLCMNRFIQIYGMLDINLKHIFGKR